MEFLKNRLDLEKVNVIDEWRLILTDFEIDHGVQKCADFINKNFVGKEIVLTCILKGAVYFFADLSRKLLIPYSCYFIEASSYKDNQTQDDKLEILSRIIPSKFENKYVILIDELFDNGNTMKLVKEAIHLETKVPEEKIFTCTLFKKTKNNKKCEDFHLDLYAIDVPDVWLVGYGLDDQQKKRGWTHLFACPKENESDKTKDDTIFNKKEDYENMRKQIINKIFN